MSTKIPKIMHFYWDKSPLSYLQYMTVVTFNKFNPDWRVIIHEGDSRCSQITWDSGEQTINYTGNDWYHELKKLTFVEFNAVDFKAIGFREDVPEVFKSDYLRWYLLSTVGGGWSDMDILYLKPIATLNLGNATTIICFRGDVHIIGFFLSKPNNQFFKEILDDITPDFDTTNYQSIGSTLLNKIHPNGGKYTMGVKNIKMDCLYPYQDVDIPALFHGIDLSKITDETIGVHWYNGSDISKHFNNNYEVGSNEITNTITEILKQI